MKFEMWESIQQQRAAEREAAMRMYPKSPELWPEPETITPGMIEEFNAFLAENPRINGQLLAEKLLGERPERRTRETVMQWMDNPMVARELVLDEPMNAQVDPESLEWRTPADVPFDDEHAPEATPEASMGILDDAGDDDDPDDCPERGNYVL